MALLITANELAECLNDPSVRVIDCRFNLMDAAAGRQAWQAGHIPGAFYADLDQDLASSRTETSGRHPLPDADDFGRLLGAWGVTPETRVVAYDDVGGAVAGRLWWLLGWAGHTRVSLLDGGLQTWLASGGTLSTVPPVLKEGFYPVKIDSKATIQADEVQSRLAQGDLKLVDARDAARFAGQVEPIDSRAGHIPGSLNRPFQDNLQGGAFKNPAILRDEFAALLTGRTELPAAFSCGSGVTACHNLFALELSGLAAELAVPPALYVGSWSEWIRAPERPCEPG